VRENGNGGSRKGAKAQRKTAFLLKKKRLFLLSFATLRLCESNFFLF